MTRSAPMQPHPITSLIPALILAITSAVSPLIHAEEAVVIGNWCENPQSSTGGCSAVFRVDLATGKRTLLSAYTKADEDASAAFSSADSIPSQLVLDRSGKFWAKVVMASSGDIFVFAGSNHAAKSGIYRISPTDGSRQLISNVEDIKSGPIIEGGPNVMAITPTNQILVGIERPPSPARIISINPATGQRITLSDGSISSQGPDFYTFGGVDQSGRLWGTGSDGSNLLIQIDANTGIRTKLRSVESPINFSDMLIDSANNIYEDTVGALYQYDGIKGFSKLLSDYSNATQGPQLAKAIKMVWDSNGRFLVLDDGKDGTVNLGGIYAVDPNTGNRTLITNFLDENQGPIVYKTKDLAVGTMPAFVGNGGGGGNTGGNGGNGGGSSSGTEPTLSNTESADSVQTGQPFSYTVTFTNFAASAATSVKLTDTLPKKSKLVSMISSQGKCKGKTKIVCNFGTVASGANVTATFTVTRKKPGLVKNSAVLTYKMAKAGAKKKKSYKLTLSEKTTVN